MRKLPFLLISLLCIACQSSTLGSAYDRIMEVGLVRIGVRNDNPPMSFIDEQGNWVGFDVDLSYAMAEELGVEAELVVVDGTTRISFLQERQVDMSVASMNHTRQRDEAIDFSITYFWDNQSFLVRTSTYQSIADLVGKKVAANAGSSAIASWQAFVAEAGGPAPEIIEFNDKLAAMQALHDGAVEGYTEDNLTLLTLAAGDPGLTLLPGGHNPVRFGVGLPINDFLRWRDQVNFVLQDIWMDGTYMAIYDQWFTGPGAMLPRPFEGEMEIWP